MNSQSNGSVIEPRYDDDREWPQRLPDHWSPFEPIGEGLTCSYCQIAPDLWTWKFRNEGTRKIAVVTFQFRDRDGWREAIMPWSLKPGAMCGGSAAFTAQQRPRILIRSIRRV